jgi:hypothetical protein
MSMFHYSNNISSSTFLSDDVEVSEDNVSPGNFAVKARAALSALSSPPDKVRCLRVKSDSWLIVTSSSISISIKMHFKEACMCVMYSTIACAYTNMRKHNHKRHKMTVHYINKIEMMVSFANTLSFYFASPSHYCFTATSSHLITTTLPSLHFISLCCTT